MQDFSKSHDLKQNSPQTYLKKTTRCHFRIIIPRLQQQPLQPTRRLGVRPSKVIQTPGTSPVKVAGSKTPLRRSHRSGQVSGEWVMKSWWLGKYPKILDCMGLFIYIRWFTYVRWFTYIGWFKVTFLSPSWIHGMLKNANIFLKQNHDSPFLRQIFLVWRFKQMEDFVLHYTSKWNLLFSRIFWCAKDNPIMNQKTQWIRMSVYPKKTNYTPKYSIGLIYLPTKPSFLEGRYPHSHPSMVYSPTFGQFLRQMYVHVWKYTIHGC